MDGGFTGKRLVDWGVPQCRECGRVWTVVGSGAGGETIWKPVCDCRSNKAHDQADRDNDGKLQYSLIDLAAFEPLVRVLEYGSRKYDRDNWKKGLPTTQITDSLLRHLVAWMDGEDDDPESGLSHLGHVAANIMFLLRFSGTEWDDRRKENE